MARGTASLKAIVCIAPLLGTFGIALELVNALVAYRVSDGETAGGTAEAYVLLVISLPVAILACVGFHYLSHQVDTFDFEMRTATLDLLNSLARAGRGRR